MQRRVGIGLLICLLTSSGCAAFHPLQGIPADQLPDDIRRPHRSGETTIDLSRLRQTPPPEHYVDGGDVLGIYVEGLLGRDGDVPPVYLPQERFVPPSVGYPIAVQEDGTISLPSIGPLYVRGLTIRGVEQAIRQECTAGPRALLQQGEDRILVSLQRPRMYSVLVIRQEADNPLGSIGSAESGKEGLEKRGTGRAVFLPAYKNDVLHALADTGGLPGLDAHNTVYIVRGQQRPAGWIPTPLTPAITIRGQSPTHRGAHAPMRDLTNPPNPSAPPGGGARPVSNLYQSNGNQSRREWQRISSTSGGGYSEPFAEAPNSRAPVPNGNQVPGSQPGPPNVRQASYSLPAYPAAPNAVALSPEEPLPPELSWVTASAESPTIIRIPLRQFPGEAPKFTEQDVILQEGDIVFIESRDTEVFYTGGLLGGGQYTLPRDYDINVLDAIAIAESRGKNYGANSRAIGGVSALNQDVTVGASKVIILRKQCDESQLAIEVDLYKAMRDPSHRIVIRPEDRIFLRYTRIQAVAAILERHILEGFLIGAATQAAYGN